MDGIIVMYSGTDSPFKVEASGTAKLINRAYQMMKDVAWTFAVCGWRPSARSVSNLS